MSPLVFVSFLWDDFTKQGKGHAIVHFPDPVSDEASFARLIEAVELKAKKSTGTLVVTTWRRMEEQSEQAEKQNVS